MNIYVWRHNKTYHSHSMIEEPCLNSEFYLDAIAIVVASSMEEALEKYHNKGCFKRTMTFLFTENNLDPFDTFYLLANNCCKKLKLLNDDEAYKYLFETLKNKVSNLDFLQAIKLDYLLKNKIKPKIWWDYNISKEEIKYYFEIFNKEHKIDSHTYYNYSHIEKNGNELLLFIYKNNKVTMLKSYLI